MVATLSVLKQRNTFLLQEHFGSKHSHKDGPKVTTIQLIACLKIIESFETTYHFRSTLKESDESLRLSSDTLVEQSDAYLRAKTKLDKQNETAQNKCSIKNELHNFRDALS